MPTVPLGKLSHDGCRCTVDARVERFNDGEIFVEVFENVRGEDMYIIQPTSNPANDNLMELLIIADDSLFWLRAPRSSQQGADADHCKTGFEHDCRSRNRAGADP